MGKDNDKDNNKRFITFIIIFIIAFAFITNTDPGSDDEGAASIIIN